MDGPFPSLRLSWSGKGGAGGPTQRPPRVAGCGWPSRLRRFSYICLSGSCRRQTRIGLRQTGRLRLSPSPCRCRRPTASGRWRYVAFLAFPVLFCMTALPWPVWMEDYMVQSLMRGNARICAELMTLFGQPALAEGNLIQVGKAWVNVEEACSGIRSLQTAFMVSLFLGGILEASPVRPVRPSAELSRGRVRPKSGEDARTHHPDGVRRGSSCGEVA